MKETDLLPADRRSHLVVVILTRNRGAVLEVGAEGKSLVTYRRIENMALNKKLLDASPQQVFDMLKDPYEYPNWIVGAKEIRGVDPGWPRIGSVFHHSSGVNGEVKDKTEILEIHEPHRIVLRAHLKPLGLARIEFTLRERPAGRTLLEFKEMPEPGTKLASIGFLLAVPLYLRNLEALRRFEKALNNKLGRATA